MEMLKSRVLENWIISCVRKLDYFGRSLEKQLEIEYSFSEPEIYVDLSGNKDYFFD